MPDVTHYAPAIPAQAESDDRLIDLWVDGRSPATQRLYRSTAKQFLAHTQLRLPMLTLGHIQAYAASLSTMTASSAKTRLAVVKSLFTFAHKIGYVGFNPRAAFRLPTVRNTLSERIISEGDVLAMITGEPNDRNRAMLWLLYVTGIRRQELCGLRVRDCLPRGSAGQITVFGKGGKTRAIMVHAKTWVDVRPFFDGDPDSAVFRTSTGKSIGAYQVWNIVKMAAKRAGLSEKIPPHFLRHANASHALDNGANLALVQQTLGHTSVATTGAYLHVRPGESSSKYIRR